MKYTLQEEEQELYLQDPLKHAGAAWEANLKLEQSEVGYHDLPVRTLYLPKIYTEEGYQYLKENVEHMWRILVRVTEEYLQNPEYRKLFGFSAELEELILNRPVYKNLIPVCRLDLFLNEETGEFAFCEFNTDGTSAMNENRVLNNIFDSTPIIRELREVYDLQSFELFDSLAEKFLEIYREGYAEPEFPTVAVVDFGEYGCSPEEFEMFRAAFERQGCRACVPEIRTLRYDGKHLMTEDGIQIDVVYRRAVTSDIMAKQEEIQPFLQAARDKNVCLMGDFCTQIAHDKILFKVLHLPETAAFLEEPDREYIRRHIPYTAQLSEELASDPSILENKDSWILKPEDSYGARSIFAGVLLSAEEWKKVLKEHVGSPFILQKFQEPYRTANIACEETESGFQAYSNLTGLYLYGGRLAGIYSRSSRTPVISVEGNEHEMPTYVNIRQ